MNNMTCRKDKFFDVSEDYSAFRLMMTTSFPENVSNVYHLTTLIHAED
jgi:hypothetical protein